MGLQIRVKHALGERVIELPDRTVEQPLVVGRSTSADVQVPSVTVAARHCALFIHEGRWVVQDLGAGGTSVNGQPVAEPVLLQIGDAITVGTDALAPTIEVDPAAAAEGRTGYAGSGLSGGSPAPSSGGYAVPGYPGGYGNAGYGNGGGYGGSVGMRPPMAVAPAPVAVAYDEAPEPAPEAAADLSAAAASAPSYRRRRKDGSAATQFAVIAICFVMITGLVALVIWKVKETNDNAKAQANQPVVIIQREAPTTRYIRATPPTTVATGPKPVFVGMTPPRKNNPKGPAGEPDDTEPTKPPANPPKANPANPGTSNPPGMEEGMDPRPPRQGTPSSPVKPGGSGVEEGMDPIRRPTTSPAVEEGMDPIRRPSSPGDATMGGTDGGGMDMVRRPATAPAAPPPRDAENISAAEATKWEVMKELAAMTGKESFAVWRFEEFKRTNSGKAAELDQMVEKKLDTIWWDRIEQLFARIERLDNLRKDIKLNKLPDVNDPKEKEALIKAFNQADTDMKSARKTLSDIMGYKDPKPPAKDEAALESARQARVPSLYNNWKLITVKAIVQNQGKLPWADEN